ncbi:MAG: twin-arginine translocase subunit TatC [Actinobacteria bacterium]|nr:twin-arginine translocase subunit TatC [Actinomycetota bacterium]
MAADGAAMPLSDHLRELRTRVFRGLIAIVIGTIAMWFLYDWFFAIITAPMEDVVAAAQAENRDVQLVLTGVADPFVLRLQVSAVAGIVMSSPVWLYQLWRFVTPGLHKHERRWSMVFVGIATPLFLAGAALAYIFLPNALGFLFDFTPQSVANYVDVSRYISFFLRTVLVFGIGFLIPLVALMLNLAGILSARALVKSWRWTILGVFLFAAVATPDGNPLTMSMLALPILLLIGVVTGIAVLHDRRARKKGDGLTIDVRDNEISPIDEITPIAAPTSVDDGSREDS